jgi:hypothetical protein
VVLWFVGVSVAAVWVVFQSPALDYRVVALGSVLPWLDAVTGGPWVLHTLVASVAALAIVMLATQRRRLVRRRWLGIPIGMFLHLVLDGVFTRSALFWWPVLGDRAAAFDGRLLELDRPLGVTLLMEAAGVAALAWLWSGFGLADPSRRRELFATGRLPRID